MEHPAKTDRRHRPRIMKAAAGIIAIVAAVALAACGSSSSSSSSSASASGSSSSSASSNAGVQKATTQLEPWKAAPTKITITGALKSAPPAARPW